jgi:hypothetical protein
MLSNVTCAEDLEEDLEELDEVTEDILELGINFLGRIYLE